MAMLYASQTGRYLRGTLAGFFLVGIGMSLTALVATGSFGVEELRLALLPIPGIAVGFAVSTHGARYLDAGRTRPAILAVSALERGVGAGQDAAVRLGRRHRRLVSSR